MVFNWAGRLFVDCSFNEKDRQQRARHLRTQLRRRRSCWTPTIQEHVPEIKQARFSRIMSAQSQRQKRDLYPLFIFSLDKLTHMAPEYGWLRFRGDIRIENLYFR